MQRKKQFSKVTGALCFLVVLTILYYFLFPISSMRKDVEISIHRGTSLNAIADSLRVHEVVRSSKVLMIWLKLTGTDRKIQAGKFTFKIGEGIYSASRKLLHGTPLEKMITIQEGLTIEQIARHCAGGVKTDTAEFIRLCRDPKFIRKLNIDAPSLEGYLFPDSYRFPEFCKPEEIIRVMVSRFIKAYENVQCVPEISQKFTKNQILTMASIVEKEAVLAEERPRIAGVFYNRLQLGYPLGADPTVRYVLRKFNGPLNSIDLCFDSPYNTRKYQGLPPGPICSPGLASIQAAAAPLKTDELYFVARWDGTGSHDFSLTNEEHAKKKFKIRRMNELRKKSMTGSQTGRRVTANE